MNSYSENTRLRIAVYFFMIVFLSISIKYMLGYGLEIKLLSEEHLLYKILSDIADLLLTIGFIGVVFDLIAKKNIQEEFMQLLIKSFYSSDKIFTRLSQYKQKDLAYDALKNLLGKNRAKSMFVSLVEPYLDWNEKRYKYNFNYEVRFEDKIKESIYGETDSFLVTEKLNYIRKFDKKEVTSGFYLVLVNGDNDTILNDSDLRLYTTVINSENNSFFDKLINNKKLLGEFIDYRINNRNIFEDLEQVDIIQKNKTVLIIKSNMNIELNGNVDFNLVIKIPCLKIVNTYPVSFSAPTNKPNIIFYPPINNACEVESFSFITGLKLTKSCNTIENCVMLFNKDDDKWIFPDSGIVFQWNNKDE